MRIIPNVSAEAFTFSAVIIGYLLIDDMTSNEQNALGNWLMLVAQILCTNAFFQQVQMERSQNNVPSDKDTVEMLKKMVNALNKEIDDLKKNI